MIVADVFFAIGRTHDICQDYGVAEMQAPARAVVCDGCSSSQDTDIGARLLARVAAQRAAIPFFDPYQTIQWANIHRLALVLAPEVLDTTLLFVREAPGGDAEVYACGDGVIAARRRDGSGYAFWVLSFNHNAPEYLSYHLDPARHRVYRADGCGVLTVEGPAVAPETGLPPGVHFHKVFPRAKYDVVLVLTDGAESFQRRDGVRFEPVPLTDVLDQVLDFKTLTPGFLRRRLGRFLRYFCLHANWHHNDDFAVAGLVLEGPA